MRAALTCSVKAGRNVHLAVVGTAHSRVRWVLPLLDVLADGGSTRPPTSFDIIFDRSWSSPPPLYVLRSSDIDILVSDLDSDQEAYQKLVYSSFTRPLAANADDALRRLSYFPPSMDSKRIGAVRRSWETSEEIIRYLLASIAAVRRAFVPPGDWPGRRGGPVRFVEWCLVWYFGVVEILCLCDKLLDSLPDTTRLELRAESRSRLDGTLTGLTPVARFLLVSFLGNHSSASDAETRESIDH